MVAIASYIVPGASLIGRRPSPRLPLHPPATVPSGDARALAPSTRVAELREITPNSLWEAGISQLGKGSGGGGGLADCRGGAVATEEVGVGGRRPPSVLSQQRADVSALQLTMLDHD